MFLLLKLVLNELQLNKEGFTFFNAYNSKGILFNVGGLLSRKDFIDTFFNVVPSDD